MMNAHPRRPLNRSAVPWEKPKVSVLSVKAIAERVRVTPIVSTTNAHRVSLEPIVGVTLQGNHSAPSAPTDQERTTACPVTARLRLRHLDAQQTGSAHCSSRAAIPFVRCVTLLMVPDAGKTAPSAPAPMLGPSDVGHATSIHPTVAKDNTVAVSVACLMIYRAA